MGFLYYNEVDKASQKYYPDWDGAKPNLETFLNALNLSQPIIGSQFELIYSRWPRTTFFAKNISVPGISANTIEINHAGFTISIPTHVKYDSTELTMTIIADKEGYHYYDWRNMVLQSGHPLIAGDPRSMIGKTKSDTNEDYLDVRLRNKTNDRTHHHWTIHNFRPIGIGEIELSHDSSSFVEFEITGTFTHVTYMTGDDQTSNEKAQAAIKQQEQMKSNEENWPLNDDVKVEFTDGTTPDDIGQPDTQPEEEQPEEEQSKPPPNLNIMNAEDKLHLFDGPDGTPIEIQESYASCITFSDTKEFPPNEEVQQAASECNTELNKLNEDLQKELEEIAKMPADPNYESESELETFNAFATVDTPAQGQDTPENYLGNMSEESKLAMELEKSHPEWEDKQQTKDALKEKLRENPEHMDKSDDELNQIIDKAYDEFDKAYTEYGEHYNGDKASVSKSLSVNCTSEAQKQRYQEVIKKYQQDCQSTLNKYKESKLAAENKK